LNPLLRCLEIALKPSRGVMLPLHHSHPLSIIFINQYFELIGFCLNSLKIINYNKIIIVRYSLYSLLNSRYLKLIKRVRALLSFNTEIIEIKDSPVNSRSASPPGYIKAE
jgi:hypothetical protein